MNYLEAIKDYNAATPQESADKALMLEVICRFQETILTRDCRLAHLTASGFILNKTLDATLMIHHNIYQTWAWTGGHCDGNPDLFAVAQQEALEETGLQAIDALSPDIIALDILTVPGHVKNGHWIAAHLHLNAAFVFIADRQATISHKPDENSAVAWIPLSNLEETSGEPEIIPVYRKLIERAHAMQKR